VPERISKKKASKKPATRAGTTRKKPTGAPGPEDDGSFQAATRPSIERLIVELHRLYPDADCELDWRNPLELLIATILSAQSTDKRVNLVTRELFEKYPTVEAFASAETEEFQKDIQSTGFYRQKSKNVLATARMIVDEFGGQVPETLEQLVQLPGVARKTANVVLGTALGKAVGVVVDTHVKRLAYRLGLSRETDPVKVERDLMDALPNSEWIFVAHALIWHGRRVCAARKPKCDECGLASSCPRNGLA
jgi:endonuclease-3